MGMKKGKVWVNNGWRGEEVKGGEDGGGWK